MPRYAAFLPVALGLALLSFRHTAAQSPPSETLLPNTTRGYVSIVQAEQLQEQLKKTQWGEFAADPALKEFWEDLGDQLELKMDKAGVDLGIGLKDLKAIAAGETATALIQPDAKSHARALIIDVSDRKDAVAELLARIDGNLKKKGAVVAAKKVGTDTITTYNIPTKPIPHSVSYCVRENTLMASDHEAMIIGMLGRFNVAAPDALAGVVAFKGIDARVDTLATAGIASDLKWFIEPLGFAETVRLAGGGRKKRGLDPLKVLKEQGFDGIQGIGGSLFFAQGDHHVLHHTMLYAPPVAGAPAGKRFRKAANILELVNDDNLAPQAWVPNEVSTYLSLNVNVDAVFDNFGKMFDAFTEEGIWEETLSGLKSDPNGPQVDITNHLVKNVTGRITLLSDYALPIHVKSEHLLVAFELKDDKDKKAEKEAAAAIAKVMKNEPNARSFKLEGHDVWEIRDRVEEAELPEIKIDGPGVLRKKPKFDVIPVAAAAPIAHHPWTMLITVTKGQIFVATHQDLLAKVLPAAIVTPLVEAPDYVRVAKELDALSGGPQSLRHFTRTDEAFHTTYELIRQGKMPDAESLLARMLNAMLSSGVKGEHRQAEINGSKLPPFENVKQHLGPGGLVLITEPEGWRVSGTILKK